MRIRVKFCGITRREDALHAIDLGVDAVGLIFAPTSRRRVDPAQAKAIARALPPFVCRVALFMDAPMRLVEDVLIALRPDLLQFHGAEDAEYCGAFRRPYLKAVPMHDVDDVARFVARYPDASGFVLDSHRVGAAGGTGQTFDWSRATGGGDRPMILAGGLTAGNVARAIREVQPYAVDVSSGIESEPGIKDYAKMASFLDEVRRVGS